MTARLFRAALAAILVLLLHDHAARAENIVLSGLEEKVPLERVDYLELPSRIQSPDQIEAEWRRAFRPANTAKISPGFSSSAHWLRFEVANRSDIPLMRWLEIGHARLEHVSLFERTAEGWRESVTGTQVPRRDRPVVAAIPVLPLSIPAGQTRIFLVRVQSVTVVGMAATIWEPLAFRSAQAHVQLVQAVLMGAVGLAATFSLLAYWFIRTRDHLAFGLGLVCFTFSEAGLDGLAMEYLWPADRPFMTWMVPLWISGSIVCFLLFYRSFLDLPRHFPALGRICVALIAVIAVGAVILDYGQWSKLNAVAAASMAAIGVFAGFAAHAKGFRAARWFLAGMGTLWLSLLPNILVVLWVLPPSPFIQLSLPLAVAIASILTLVALADRLRQLQQAKAQADALAIIRLEEQVKERTYELEEALTEANAANRAKTDFLAHISHDLRTPLHTVIGYAQLIQRGSRRIPPRDGAGAIEASARRLLALIDDLLDYVRGEVGKLRVEPQSIYWHGLMSRIVEDARHLTETAGNRFRVEAHGTFPMAIVVDEQRLRQVLDNLLSNANRHTRFGTVTLAVQATPNAENQSVHLVFRVLDTGCGIPPEKVAEIFKPFVSGSHGIGLGLAISRQLAAALRADLRLDYTSASGTGFSFEMSCAVATESDVPMPEPVSRYSGYGGPRRTILVAEDVAENRRFIHELLTDAGFDVLSVAGGREALDWLNQGVDLVLTDQSMPDGDGWQLLRGVRDMALTIPVVLISAAPPRAPDGFPADMAFSAILLKPVNCDLLLETVGRLLGIQWTCEIAPPDTGPATVPHLPEADARHLRRLIDAGDFTGIEELVESLESRGGSFAEAAEQIGAATARLDFSYLREVVERSIG